MKILISNDDGIYSPGIVGLANVGSSFGPFFLSKRAIAAIEPNILGRAR
jgi:hypothetical protein